MPSVPWTPGRRTSADRRPPSDGPATAGHAHDPSELTREPGPRRLRGMSTLCCCVTGPVPQVATTAAATSMITVNDPAQPCLAPTAD